MCCAWFQVLGAFAKLGTEIISLFMSVRLSAWNNTAPTGQFFIKFDIWGFFENLSRKLHFHCNRTRETGNLRGDQDTFFVVSHSVLPRMKHISDNVVEKPETHILCLLAFFLKKKRGVYEIMWKNIVEPDRPQMTIWRMRIACCIPKSANIPYM